MLNFLRWHKSERITSAVVLRAAAVFHGRVLTVAPATIADIYEAVWYSTADTVMADAFRRAVGLPPRASRGDAMVALARESVYAGVDFERLMGQRHGVRM